MAHKQIVLAPYVKAPAINAKILYPDVGEFNPRTKMFDRYEYDRNIPTLTDVIALESNQGRRESDKQY